MDHSSLQFSSSSIWNFLFFGLNTLLANRVKANLNVSILSSMLACIDLIKSAALNLDSEFKILCFTILNQFSTLALLSVVVSSLVFTLLKTITPDEKQILGSLISEMFSLSVI